MADLPSPTTRRDVGRDASLDTRRGAAIVLMVVDHAAATFLAVTLRVAPDLYVLTEDELGLLRHTLNPTPRSYYTAVPQIEWAMYVTVLL